MWTGGTCSGSRPRYGPRAGRRPSRSRSRSLRQTASGYSSDACRENRSVGPDRIAPRNNGSAVGCWRSCTRRPSPPASSSSAPVSPAPSRSWRTRSWSAGCGSTNVPAPTRDACCPRPGMRQRPGLPIIPTWTLPAVSSTATSPPGTCCSSGAGSPACSTSKRPTTLSRWPTSCCPGADTRTTCCAATTRCARCQTSSGT